MAVTNIFSLLSWNTFYVSERTSCCLSVAKFVWLSATPWTAACQAPLSFTISKSLLRFMSIESVMPSNTSSSVAPFSSAPYPSQHQGLFQWAGSSCWRPKYWSFSISPSNEYSGLISFRMDWFDLPAVQRTLKSLIQHHNLKGQATFLDITVLG